MAPTSVPPVDKKVEKGYFSSAVDSMNPWAGSRSTTPTPKEPASSSTTPPLPSTSGPSTVPGYHTTSHVYGQSLKRYPPDCPPLNVMWFHAVDVSWSLLSRAFPALDLTPGTDPQAETQIPAV